MIAITSQHRLGIVYPSAPSTFQGQDQLDVYKPAVKWGGPIFSRERIPEVVRMAFREMWSGRPGPVQLEVPAPVLYDTGDEAGVSVVSPESYRAPLPQISARQLDEAADLLANAERPLVIAGGGVERADAGATLLAIVERLGCPVLTSMAARSAVPTDHPSRIYGIGAGGDVAKREADVVLAVGTRLGNLDLPYDKYWGDSATKKLIQIDIDPRNIGVTRPLALGIVADVGSALEALAGALESRGAGAGDGTYLQRCRDAAAAWSEEQLAMVAGWSGPGMHPAHVMAGIGKVFGRDAIYVTDGGNTSLWANWFLPPTRPRSYLNILELGMLGTGVPSAVGAKLGSPERDVVCVTGDGAAGFHFMEMQSAAREGLGITTIVFSEGSWTMEEPNEQMLYGRTFGTAMGKIDWHVVGQGLGCEGYAVERIEDLEPALESARKSEGPTVVCVRTDRGANLAVPQDAMMRFFEVYQGPTE